MGCGASSEASTASSRQKENNPSSSSSSPAPPTSSNCTIDDTQNKNDEQNKREGVMDVEPPTANIIKSDATNEKTDQNNTSNNNNYNNHATVLGVDESAAQILPPSRKGEEDEAEQKSSSKTSLSNNQANHIASYSINETDNEASFQRAPGPVGTKLNSNITENRENNNDNNNDVELTPSPFNNLTPQELKKLKREKQQRQQEIDELQNSLSAKNKRIDWDELSDKFPFEKEDSSAKREREILLATIREEENNNSNCEISLNTLTVGLKLHLGQAAESSVRLDYPILAATKRAIELTTTSSTKNTEKQGMIKDPLLSSSSSSSRIKLNPEHEREQFRLILRFLREYFELYQIYEELGIEASEQKLTSLLEEQEKFVDLDVDADDFYDDDDDDDDETDMKDIQGNYKNLENKNLLKIDLEEFKKAGPLLEKWGAKIGESLEKTFEEILSEKNNPGTEAASSSSAALLLFDDLAEWAMKQSK